MEKYQVYLGSRASIWSHRGYRVVGGTVYTEDHDTAVRIARESLDDDAAEVGVDGATYYYDSQEAADADDDGSSADAVVSRVDEEEAE